MQTETDWLQEKATLLKSIKQKQEKLRDYEQRFLPTTIDEEREVVKEKHLQKDIEMLKSKIDRVKKEIEVLKLKKELKELEEENASLSSQGSK